MDLEKRIYALSNLGRFLNQFGTDSPTQNSDIPANAEFFDLMSELMHLIKIHNAWFSFENQQFTYKEWASVLTEENLKAWVKPYTIPVENPKTVALILGDKTPLSGFHDFVSVLISGHKAQVRLSEHNNKLLPFLTRYLTALDPSIEQDVEFVKEQISNYDAVIVHGNDKTAVHFGHYLKDIPHIIRKNLNSVAVLTGKETHEDLQMLSNDIFRYYGLSNRNVSKVYVPENYDFTPFYQAVFDWKDLTLEVKYMNNYDYNKAVYLMSNHNSNDLLDNEFLLLKQDPNLASPVGVVFYSYYANKAELIQELEEKADEIEVILGDLSEKNSLKFGESHTIKLDDYADAIDTLEFLSNLN